MAASKFVLRSMSNLRLDFVYDRAEFAERQGARVISLGVDVGGTNTDIILGGLEQGVIVHKLPSTNDDPARATVQGTLEICELAGIAPGDIDLVLHGTTVATNALLEHDG